MLSTRQLEIGRLLVKGKSAKEIAYSLGISIHTCNEHIRILYAKLGVGTRGECVARLVRLEEAETES